MHGFFFYSRQEHLLSIIQILSNKFHLYSKIFLILYHDHVFKIKTILFRYPTKTNCPKHKLRKSAQFLT